MGGTGRRAVRAAIVVALVAIVAIVGGLAAPPTQAAAAPTRFIVRVDDAAALPAVVGHLVATGVGVVNVLASAGPAVVVDLPPGAVAAVDAIPGVSGVEADQVVSLAGGGPTSSWALDRLDQRTRPLDGAYRTATTGAGVTIYIVDSGVRASHREIAGRARPGLSTIAGQQSMADCLGHGTLVASIAGGTTTGAAPGAAIVPVKVFGCEDTTAISNIVQALNWIAADHTSGPAVVNMSIEGGPSTSLDNAVRALIAEGVTVVAAAGNAGPLADACQSSPNNVPEVIVAGATDGNDLVAEFSSSGSCVDVFAPGVGVPGASHAADAAYRTGNGTSFAAPLAAGIAARWLQAVPGITPAQVRSAIVGEATPGLAAVLPVHGGAASTAVDSLGPTLAPSAPLAHTVVPVLPTRLLHAPPGR